VPTESSRAKAAVMLGAPARASPVVPKACPRCEFRDPTGKEHKCGLCGTKLVEEVTAGA
jgi:hypothetical protein